MLFLTTLSDWIFTASTRAAWLTLIVLAVRALARNHLPARWRYALWLPVLLVLLTPHFPNCQWSLDSLLRKVDVTLSIDSGSLVFLPNKQWLLHLWLTGTAVMGLLGPGAFAHTLWRFRRGRVPVDAKLRGEITSLAKELGLLRMPRVWTAPEIRSPAVTGLYRPILLLPHNFKEKLTSGEMRFVLKHELMHIKRWDLPLNALVWLLLSLHWFNPLLWIAYFMTRLDREAACDAQVLEHEPPTERVAYGHTLLKMESSFGPVMPGLGFVGIFQRGYPLRSRIHSIAKPATPKPLLKVALGFGIPLFTFFGITKAESKAGPLDGVWINTDSATLDIPKIEIKGNQFVYWGKTHSYGSKYGPFTLTLSGDSVEDSSPNKYGYLTEDAGFADNVMMIKRVGEKLVIDGVKAFKDGSGRANYHLSLTFTKQT